MSPHKMRCCSGKCCLAVTSLLVLGVAYYIYMPLPDILANGDQAWPIRRNMALIRFSGHMAKLAAFLGFDPNEINRALMKPPPTSHEGLEVTNTELKGIPVRIYRPPGLAPQSPAVVFYHGGGWIWGSIDSHDTVTSALARLVPAVVVSVEYRLAPEHPYPIPLQDCLDATIEFMHKAKDYGVDPNRIGIAGDSAGGNLAAAVALKLRDLRHPIQPKLQMMVYPVVQGLDLQLPSFIDNAGRFMGSPRGMAHAILSYMGVKVTDELKQTMVDNRHTSKSMKEKYGKFVSADLLPARFRGDYKMEMVDGDVVDEKISKLLVDPYFFPLMAEDLSRLPKVFILSCEFDSLRDEDIMFARRLEQAGVEVTWVHYDDGFHSIMNFVSGSLALELGLRLQKDMVEYLQENL